MFKPIILQTHLDTSGNVPCPLCGELARWWEVEEGRAICSVCFLYEHEEGVELTDRIEEFIQAIEKERGYPASRTTIGRLAPREADNMLAVLVLTTRVFLAEDQMIAAQEDDADE